MRATRSSRRPTLDFPARSDDRHGREFRAEQCDLLRRESEAAHRHRGAEQRIGRALYRRRRARSLGAERRRAGGRIGTNESRSVPLSVRSLWQAAFPEATSPGGEKIPGSIAAESRPTATDRNARVSPERKNDDGKQTQSRNRQAGKPYTGLKKSRVSRHRASGKTRKPDEPARKRNFYKNATKPCTARCNTRFFSS